MRKAADGFDQSSRLAGQGLVVGRVGARIVLHQSWSLRSRQFHGGVFRRRRQSGMGLMIKLAIINAIGQFQRQHFGQLLNLALKPIDHGVQLLCRKLSILLPDLPQSTEPIDAAFHEHSGKQVGEVQDLRELTARRRHFGNALWIGAGADRRDETLGQSPSREELSRELNMIET